MPTLADLDLVPVLAVVLVLFVIRKRPKRYKVNRRFLRRYMEGPPRGL